MAEFGCEAGLSGDPLGRGDSERRANALILPGVYLPVLQAFVAGGK